MEGVVLKGAPVQLVKSPFVTMSKQIEYYPAQRGCERCPLGAQAGSKKPAGGRTPYHIGTIYEAIFFLPNSSGLRPALDASCQRFGAYVGRAGFRAIPWSKVHTLD